MIKKLKALFIINREVNKMKNIKSGWKTSEFWLSALSAVCAVYGAVQGFFDPKITALIITYALSLYTISRVIVKLTPSTKDDEFVDKVAEIVKNKITMN